MPDNAEIAVVINALTEAFTEANRQDFLDLTVDDALDPSDPDLPILRAVMDLLVRAWHEGYGDGASNATDGWMTPGRQPRRVNPYNVPVLPPNPCATCGWTDGHNPRSVACHIPPD